MQEASGSYHYSFEDYSRIISVFLNYIHDLCLKQQEYDLKLQNKFNFYFKPEYFRLRAWNSDSSISFLNINGLLTLEFAGHVPSQ